MYHEGVKEAATKNIQAENKASSARIRVYLIYGKKTVPEKSSYDANIVDKQEHTIVPLYWALRLMRQYVNGP